MKYFFTITILFCISCILDVDHNKPLGIDVTPPQFLSYDNPHPQQIVFYFDENIKADLQFVTLKSDDPMGVESIQNTEKNLILFLSKNPVPGKEYRTTLIVEDRRGNRNALIIPIYGYNPKPPRLLINEFISEGSSGHPDITELISLESGNIGGITIYEGSPKNWDDHFILPSLEVEKGDLILIHWKPSEDQEEIDEHVSKDESGGIDASDTAWDFWVVGGDGIPNTTGVLSLVSHPHGEEIMDAVLYCATVTSKGVTKRAFGKRSDLLSMEYIVEKGEWKVEGEKLTPEDTVDTAHSTTTRSVNRSSPPKDTNHKEDWHISPTRGSSLGENNTLEVYQP